jgi:protein-disulfide isomerase
MLELMQIALKVPLLAVAVAAAVWAQSGNANSDSQLNELRQEVQSLRTQMDELRNTVKELSARFDPVLDISAAPSKGDPAAKIVMIEFSDFQCPYCLEYYKSVYRPLIDEYVKTGKIRYVVRDFPGESIHPNAMKAAEAARCAAEQGKFWEMHDALFDHQRDLATTGVRASAEAAKLNLTTFQTCVDSGRFPALIRQDVNDASRLGAKGTPAFFFGAAEGSGKVRLITGMVGAQQIDAFRKVIDGLLAK